MSTAPDPDSMSPISQTKLSTSHIMNKALFFLLQISLCTVGCLSATASSTLAQVTSDGTVNTQVNQNGNVAEITGGETRGSNLFHSFQQFSVGTGNEAFFNNANDISSIFSRVTGGSASNIDGLIRANDANLFLINPAGILFGAGARLDLGGGSFYGSSASSILFEDGEFSAADLNNPPLLTVNAPIGLSFRDNPADISVTGDSNTGTFADLTVNPGQNFTLVGGNLNFDTGVVSAPGGRIELGGLSAAGIVDINEDGSLSFSEDLAKANISLTNAADIDVSGTGGGNITINAQNLNLEAGEGEFNSSLIRSGITADSTSAEAQAGDIVINVAENITLDDSRIINQVASGGVGNSGNITIATGSLEAINGGDIDASTFGQGNAGAVEINATGDLTFDGEDSEGFQSGVTSLVDEDAVGDAGGVTISTINLTLTNGGRVAADTFGEGNAAAVEITAAEDLSFDGEDSGGSNSGVTSLVNPDAVGDAGGVTISANNLTLNNGGRVSASTLGQGDAGAVEINATGDLTFDGEDSEGFQSGVTSLVNPDAVGNAGGVTISTNNLTLTNGGRVDASTSGQGNAGAVEINAIGDLTFDGEDSGGAQSGVTSLVDEDAVGQSGGVTISTNNLTLTNGGRVAASTLGQGNAGAVEINATGDLTFDGEDSGGAQSGVTSLVDEDAVGQSGGVTISTNNLTLTNGGRVAASTLGQGDAGAVEINATGDLTFDGENSGGFGSGVTSLVNSNAVGNAGGVTISTGNLTLTNGGRVAADTFGQGNAGAVEINATGDLTFDGENSEGFQSGVTSLVTEDAEGNAGGVTISTNNLTLTNGGRVSASTLGQGNAGTLNITATGDLTFDGENSGGFQSGVTSQVNSNAEGDAGGVTISTGNLTLTNGGRVSADTLGQGNAGAVEITATGDLSFDGENTGGFGSGVTSLVTENAVGNAGGVTISTGNLTLTNGGRVSASTLGQGNAGVVEINATGDLSFDGENTGGFSSGVTSLVNEDAEGDAGGVTISTGNLTLTNGGRVSASTLGQGNAGAVEINATGDLSFDGENTGGFGSGVTSLVTENAVGNAGGVTISTSNLTLTNGGQVDASTFGRGNAGLVEITVSDSITFDGEDSSGFGSGATSRVEPDAEGDAGGVTITTGSLTLTNGGQISASTLGQGNAGAVEINATGEISFDGETLEGFNSGVFSLVNPDAVGNAGGISITTGKLALTNGAVVNSSTFGQGNAGNIIVQVDNDVSLSNSSFITSTVRTGAIGDGGNIDLEASSLTLTEGSQIQAGVFGTVDNIPGGIGNAGTVNLDIDDNLTASGFSSEGFSSGVFTIISPGAKGNGGDINVAADSILLTDSALFNSQSSGEGNAGQLTVKADSLSLENNASINASTIFGEGGNIDLQITEDIILKNNSTISARAFGEANGGNLNIDARYIVAFPNQIEGNGSDIIANAEDGEGGNIIISAESLLGIDERDAIANNQTNDIDASSEFGIGGTVSIFTPDVNPIQRETELPNNIVEPQQTTAQACAVDRETIAQNSFVIKGKGGVPPIPDSPLDSFEITVNGESANSTSTIPQPIETSQGKIQPARGIKVTKDGGIVLTAYRTNNAGDRLYKGEINCS